MADVASLVFDIDSSGAVGAAKALAKLTKASSELTLATTKLNAGQIAADGSFEKMSDVAKKNESEIRQLANAYNPLLAAQLKYADEQVRVAKAVELGVLSQANAREYLSSMNQAMANATISSGKFSRGMGDVTHQVQNASYQIGDFFVQVASGQNPMMALSQQLPQLLGSMGVLGAAAGAAAAILGAAWMVLGNGASAADRLTKSLDKLNDAIGEVRSLSSSVSLSGLDALREKYGQVDQSVMRLIENQRTYNNLVASQELRESLKAISDFAGTRWHDIGISDFASGALRLQEIFNVTRNDADAMKKAFDDIAKAKGLEAQEAALSKVAEQLRTIITTNEDVTAEQLATYEAVLKSQDAVKQLLSVSSRMPGSFENAAAAAGKIADRLNDAVSAAARLAASAVSDARFAQIELDFRTDDIGKAAAIAAAKFDAEVGKAGIDAGLFNRMRNQAIAGATEAARIMGEVERLNEADRKAEQDAKKKDKAGASKAAAELKAATKGYQSLRELMEQDSMFQVAEWEKRQAQLDAALGKRLITEKKYQELTKQLKDMYFGSEYEKNALNYEMSLQQLKDYREKEYLTEQQYAARKSALGWEFANQALDLNSTRFGAELNGMSTFFGNMNSLAGGGYDKLLKAQRSFAAASALISALNGASKALELPYPLNIAAAGKVLATGMGFVNSIKSGGSGSASAGATSASVNSQAVAATEPEKVTMVRIEGDKWITDFMGSLLEGIYKESKNGRVIIAGYNG